MAKILAVHDSSDNNTIRYAAIQLANGKQLSRPISLLYHLEIDEKQCWLAPYFRWIVYPSLISSRSRPYPSSITVPRLHTTFYKYKTEQNFIFCPCYILFVILSTASSTLHFTLHKINYLTSNKRTNFPQSNIVIRLNTAHEISNNFLYRPTDI